MIAIAVFLATSFGVVVVGVLLIPVTTTIKVFGQGTQWTMGFNANILGWHSNHAWQVPMTPAQKVKPTTGFDPKRVSQGFTGLTIYSHFVKTLWDRTSVTSFSCVLYLGLAEAASTALIIGLLNNLLGPWVSLRIAPRSSRRPVYGIYPVWDRVQFQGEFDATIRFRVINLVEASLAALIQAISLLIHGRYHK
ncbi:hypothetical protein [Sulfobacillus thermosulfidooxidans]|uniref:hypothetical protein n=1 Tax=Sulfobacillus thermosulfidooxidans TaxID=28034 RepID=UPI0012DBD687|nr:hypothetical protein [Sulfobacillus thermosulfidooxidans]